MRRIDRRCFIFAGLFLMIGAAAAESSRTFRVAHVFPTRVDTPGAFTQTVRQRLSEHGFVEGKNLELRFFSRHAADANLDPLRAQQRVLDEVIAWQPDAILVGNPAATRLFSKGDVDDSHRLREHHGSGNPGLRRKPRAPRWKRHGRRNLLRHTSGQAGRARSRAP